MEADILKVSFGSKSIVTLKRRKFIDGFTQNIRLTMRSSLNVSKITSSKQVKIHDDLFNGNDGPNGY